MAQAQQTMTNPYRDIFEQFVDEASFLWVLRSIAVKQPHYLPEDVAELEQRIENNLDGLLISSDEVWDICESALALEEPGEVFTATVVALQSLDASKIQHVLSIGLKQSETFKALISAFSWLPSATTKGWISKFLRSKDLDHKQLAVGIMSALRQDPGKYLTTLLRREDCIAHEGLYARCLRLAGEMKRADLVADLKIALQDERDSVRFWAAWSLLLLRDISSLPAMEKFVLKGNTYTELAVAIYFRTAPIDKAKKVISELVKRGDDERIAIRASAVLGDPHVVPWLIAKMEKADLARLAGEAFTQVTGIELDENELSISVPEISQLPNDDPEDQNVELDDDENLPWPDVEKIKAIWQKYGNKFQLGTRYFLGKKLTANALTQQLDHGYQRHRREAALELAINDSRAPLRNVFAKLI